MIYFESIDHVDNFNGDKCIWINVKVFDLPKGIVNKILSNTEYCILDDVPFGICLNYNHNTNEFVIIEDTPNHELYYIDEETGEKHWENYVVSNLEKYMIIDKYLNNK